MKLTVLFSVLAARIRIPNDADAVYRRNHLYHHNPKERCANNPTSHHTPKTNSGAAKYLDQIKGGRIPVEVLVRGKDAAENEKHFIKIAELIKSAGVSSIPTVRPADDGANQSGVIEESWCHT